MRNDIFWLSAIVWLATFCSPELSLAGTATLQVQSNQKTSVSFQTDILPILSNKCFTCHGQDENTREADLRLDQQDGLFQEADSGEVPVVPNKLSHSELWKRVQSTGDDRMPPPDSDLEITEDERQKIKAWIQQGAKWQKHWAFVPPIKNKPPTATDKRWNKNAIDQFIHAKHKERRLKPAPRANHEMLVRRIFLDLTGLPPTLEDRKKFLLDPSPNAYEKLVDRLLASPQYGEHMATEWLDIARYADSNGYQNDFGRSMWIWRDWVIDAYNQNKPFDRFVIEQLAGDLLKNPSRSELIATGFNRNNRTVTEGGSIDEEWHVENTVDRLETTATAFLGMTFGCARCHDHKFDPISQKEFYELYSFFNNTEEKGVYTEKRGNAGPTITVPSQKQQQKMDLLKAKEELLKKSLDKLKEIHEPKKVKWLDNLKKQTAEPTTKVSPTLKSDQSFLSVSGESSQKINSKELKSKVKNTFLGKALEFKSSKKSPIKLNANFQFHAKKPFTVSSWVHRYGQGAILSRMDKENKYRGFDVLILADGRVNVHLIHSWTDNAIKITSTQKIPSKKWTHVTVTWDGSEKAKGLNLYFDAIKVPFEINNNSLSGDTTTDHPLWLGYRGATPPFQGMLCDIHLFGRELADSQVKTLFGLAADSLLGTPKDRWNKNQKEFATKLYYHQFSSGFANNKRMLNETQNEIVKLTKLFPTTMIMKERPKRRKTYVLDRGLYDHPNKEKEVFPNTPGFLHPLTANTAQTKKGPPNRLDLANWLVDRQNPLLARVTVNRLWQHHFGVGLHKTPEDFGIQSPAPSHPKLLDWLAVDLIESGWDIKRMHKMIVMSETYRQSSSHSKENFQKDPSNRWYSRGPRFRLSAEMIRDNALAVSGLLDRKLGGPPVKPYQPAGLWVELAGGASQGPYRRSSGTEVFRRSVYTYRKRTVPPPGMTIFDGGSREVCQVARQSTNTPLQSLALLNDETYVEASRHLGQLAIRSSNETKERVANLFLRVTLRKPTDKEQAALEKALGKYLKHFRNNPDEAKKLIQVGSTQADQKLEAAELAAYTSLASVVLNLDESITRE